MKKDIHPTYYPDAQVTCACGNTFTTGSTVKEIKVEICSKCHPFYTGKQKFIDTAHRVDRFKRMQEKTNALKEVKNKKTKKTVKKVQKKQESRFSSGSKRTRFTPARLGQAKEDAKLAKK